MFYQATHVTRYHYEGTVSQSLSEVRLTPRSFPGQKLHESRLEVHPEPAVLERRKDYFGNDVTAFSVFRAHEQFSASATSIVEVEPRAEVPLPSISWEEARDVLAAHRDAPSLAAYEFIFDSPFVAAAPDLYEFAKPSFAPKRPLADAVHDLTHRIHAEFKYEPKSTSIDVPLLDVLRQRHGVCQDFAHVMIGAMRSLGLAARYVSGYLRSGAKFQGAEASHAWVSVFVPGTDENGGSRGGEWLSFDPTNDVVPSEGHVTLAWGRDYGDVTPFKGIALGGGKHTVEVEVRVQPIQMAPAI